MNVAVNDKVLVFDPKLWGGKDRGDNSQFWKEATVIYIEPKEFVKCGHKIRCRVATVRFEHDGRESPGHFIYGMRPLLKIGDEMTPERLAEILNEIKHDEDCAHKNVEWSALLVQTAPLPTCECMRKVAIA